MPQKCMVPGCTSLAGKVRMYQFTRNLKLLPVWLENIGRRDLMDNPSVARKCRICIRHFSAKQRFVCHANARTDLRQDAIPDKDIPTAVGKESVVAETVEETVENVFDAETIQDCEVIVCGLEDISACFTDTQCETGAFSEIENADYQTPSEKMNITMASLRFAI